MHGRSITKSPNERSNASGDLELAAKVSESDDVTVSVTASQALWKLMLS